MIRALLAVGLFFALSARADFKAPPLTGPVVDAAQVLQTGTVERLSQLLKRVQSSGGSQIQVVLLPDLGGLSIEEVGIRLADEWRIGRDKQDDGVILLLGMAERRVRIEVGQGREGDLPDLKANRIIREVIVPRLRAGSVDRAVFDGTLAILHYTDPQFLAQQGPSERGQWSGEKVQLALFLVLIFIALLVRFLGGPGVRRRGLRGGYYSAGWGSSSGGFGGGGWSGGGGGFSGGGSSGSW